MKTEDAVRMLYSVVHYMGMKDDSPRCASDLSALAEKLQADAESHTTLVARVSELEKENTELRQTEAGLIHDLGNSRLEITTLKSECERLRVAIGKARKSVEEGQNGGCLQALSALTKIGTILDATINVTPAAKEADQIDQNLLQQCVTLYRTYGIEKAVLHYRLYRSSGSTLSDVRAAILKEADHG